MNTYFVAFTLHNKVNGGWAFKIVNRYDDLKKAKKEYHTQLAQYVDSVDFDIVSVMIYDAYNNIIEKSTEVTIEEPIDE